MRTLTRDKKIILAGVVGVGLIGVLAAASGSGAPGSDGATGALGVPRAQVVDAWREAGFNPGGFAIAQASKLGGECERGAVNGLEVVLCSYDSAAAAEAARKPGLALVGNATGASVPSGRMLVVVADRGNADPDGKRINGLLTTFRKSAAESSL